jgi:hypothetical protein
LTVQTFGLVTFVATSTPGLIVQFPARRSLPNQATTRLTLSTAGAMACSRSSATTMSASSGSAFRFSAEVVPPVVWPKMVVVAPTVLRTASVA